MTVPSTGASRGCGSASSGSTTTTSRAGSRRSRGFPTSSRSSRCTTPIPSGPGRSPRPTTIRRCGPDSARRTAALPVETTLDDLIERHALDVALVTLPNADAPAAIERLAGAGIHLLIDKPAARTAPEARQAFDAVRAAGRPRRRRADAALLAGRSDGARAGRGRPARARSSRPRRSSRRRPSRCATRAIRCSIPTQTGGGILSWLGIHDVDTPPLADRRAGRRGQRHGRPASGRRASRSRTSSRSRCASPVAPSAPSTSPTRCRHAATGAGSRCAASTPRWSSASTRSWSSSPRVAPTAASSRSASRSTSRRSRATAPRDVPRSGTSSTRSATAARRRPTARPSSGRSRSSTPPTSRRGPARACDSPRPVRAAQALGRARAPDP